MHPAGSLLLPVILLATACTSGTTETRVSTERATTTTSPTSTTASPAITTTTASPLVTAPPRAAKPAQAVDLNGDGPGFLRPTEPGPYSNGQVLQVEGGEFPPGASVAIGQCLLTVLTTLDVFNECSINRATQAVSDFDGAFTAQIELSTFIDSSGGPLANAGSAIDCTVEICIVGASILSDLQAGVPDSASGAFIVNFDQLADPAFTITEPEVDQIGHRESLSFTGTGWLGGAVVRQCLAIPNELARQCIWTTGLDTPNADFADDLLIDRFLHDGRQVVDCAEEGQCAIVVEARLWPTRVVPITVIDDGATLAEVVSMVMTVGQTAVARSDEPVDLPDGETAVMNFLPQRHFWQYEALLCPADAEPTARAGCVPHALTEVAQQGGPFEFRFSVNADAPLGPACVDQPCDLVLTGDRIELDRQRVQIS